ncbi:beta strand repeat-containing protein [Spirosoma oryzicola]|uniref:beta strand repeat-containing protein n=1 Tax=Spirosoma oryzicola TaxID=2898794 RepID=UPI001E2CD2DC|nr:Ig-like domain-containing protein [Spirosoma oryzicola]UHG93840.1 Ig-like domain-containing protein [Spirosoma oryzicola]
MLISTFFSSQIEKLANRSIVWLLLLACVSFAQVANAQISSFTAAQIEEGNGCNWPFSALAANPKDGKVYGFWRKGAGDEAIYRLIRFDGSGWATVSSFSPTGGSASIKVPSFDGASDDVDLAIDALGRYHVTFQGSRGSGVTSTRGVWYGFSSDGTTWSFSEVQTYSDPNGWKNTDNPVLELDNNNQPHIAFLFSDANSPRTYSVRYYRQSGTSWTGEDAFSQSGGEPASNEIITFDMAVDGNTKAHFAIQRETNGEGRNGGLIYTTNSTGSWATPTVLAEGQQDKIQGSSLGIDTDAANKVHIVYSGYPGQINYTNNSAGNFSTPQRINGNLSGSIVRGSFRINSNGDKAFVYQSSGLQIAYQPSGTTGTWTTALAYKAPTGSSAGSFPSGILAPNGRIVVLFDNLNTSNEQQCGETNTRRLWYATATVQAQQAAAPTVTSAAPSAITTSSATLGGNVTADGGASVTERGIVYVAGSGTPTTSNTKVTNGNNTGSFSQTVSGLTPGTAYSVRAYAINSVGTSYGSVVTFTTTPNAPVVNTPSNQALIATTSPTYTGTAQAGSTVTVYVDNNIIGSTTASGGTFSFTQPTALGQGNHSVRTTTLIGSSAASASSNTNNFTVDTVAPTVSISSSSGSSGSDTPDRPISFTLTFSESVTGLSGSSVQVANGIRSNFSGSGTTYSFEVTPSANGLITVNLGANSARDLAGNGNTAASTFSLTYRPPVTISGFSSTPAAVCVGSPVTFSATVGRDAGTYSYTLTGGNQTITGSTVNAFSQTVTTSGSGAQNFTLRVSNGVDATSQNTSLTVNPLPVVSIPGLADAYCQDAAAVTLATTGSPAGGSFTIDGNSATEFIPANLALGTHTVVYRYTNNNGCTNSASQTVTVKEVPTAPVLVTQAGNPYPAEVSNLTISQNVGNVILTVSGCTGGTINWGGGNATTLAVSTSNLGTQTFTATCTRNGCTSPATTATVTVVAPTLKVLSRDPDNGQLGNNTIKPYLILQNVGRDPFAYSNITLRYWLTTEDNVGLIFQKNFVAIGQGNLNLRYVPISPARQGATGYIEYSFNGGAGSLAPMGDSGPLEIQVNKQDYSSFFQPDDYSYINNSSYTLNPRITAYQNGTIFYGIEPTATGSSRVASQDEGRGLAVKVLGNPVVGPSAEVEISGVSGQAVQLKLVDLQGKTLHGFSIKEAGSVERVSVPVSTAQGILLLDVSTATQRQQVKLLKP